MEKDLMRIPQMPVQEITTIAKAFIESGMFSDTKTMAQAIVKIQAGQEVGIKPFAAMTGIHIIMGKPVIGSGIIASRIKASGKYDYKVKAMTDKICTIEFFQGKELIGTSDFTIEEARKAQTKNIDKFPKNMLFARAISNGVKFYCPDVFDGPVYVPEEMGITEDGQAEVLPETGEKGLKPTIVKKQAIKDKPFGEAIERIKKGELDLYQKMLDSFELTAKQVEELETTFAESNIAA
jgi:hypothetical protein